MLKILELKKTKNEKLTEFKEKCVDKVGNSIHNPPANKE
jgi:hypothetical protein